MSKPSASKKNRVGHQTVDLYQFVIDDTVARVKGEFVQEGIAEDVLDELRAIWEDKLEKTGVCSIPEPEEEPEPEAQPPPAVTQAKQELVPLVSHGLPTHVAPQPAPAPVPAQPRQPPQVLQPPQQQQQQQQQQNYTQYNPQQHMQQQLNNMAAMQQYASMNPGAWPMAGAAQYTQQQVMQYQLATAQAMQAQQLAQYQQAPGYHMQPPVATAPLPMPPQGLSSLAGHKRSLEETGVAVNNPAHVAKQLNTGTGPGYPTIPQQDGPADDGAATAPPSAAPSAGTAAADDDDDDPLGPGDSGDELNEADDLADVDDHEEIDEESIRDVVLGQFEKVHRSKAKWKVNLKNCVATINGVDYLLKKVTGEMNF